MSRPGTFRKGFDERRGPGGGKKGRSGRKPDKVKALFRRLLTDPRALKAIQKVACDPKNPAACVAAQRYLASYALGLPRQSIDVSATSPSLEQILAQSWRKKRDRVADAEEADVTAIDGKPPRRIAIR